MNYIYKIKSNIKNEFANFILNSNTVEYKVINENSQISLDLKIPKIYNKLNSKAASAVYNIRIYPKSAFDSNDDPTTITFISYYAFATYIYKISENDENSDDEPINFSIPNFPQDKAYIISIIAVTSEEKKD